MRTNRLQVAELLRERYRDSKLLEGQGFDAPELASLLSHRSVRKYAPTPLPAGTLELLVAAAQSAASSSNLQLWSVIAVEDAERRRRLSQVANGQAHVRESGAFLVWLADLHRPTELARARGIEPEGLEFLEMFLMASIDAALAAQNAVVAAEARDLGTVYIGALRNRPEEVAEILELPERVFALFGLCVGYADSGTETAVKPRLPQDVVFSRDTYRPLENRRAAVDAYDRTMVEFYGEQKMMTGAPEWSHHSALRVQNLAALNGRHRLRDSLATLGFGLR